MRILVVEDEPEVADLVRRAFREAAWAADIVRTGIAALEALAVFEYAMAWLASMRGRRLSLQTLCHRRAAGADARAGPAAGRRAGPGAQGALTAREFALLEFGGMDDVQVLGAESLLREAVMELLEAGPPFPEAPTQGFGLSIVRWVTEIHGGPMAIERRGPLNAVTLDLPAGVHTV